MPDHYCVIYSYYNRIHKQDEIDAIKHFCVKHHLTPVAIGAPQYWLENYVVCSPFQCLKVFENARGATQYTYLYRKHARIKIL